MSKRKTRFSITRRGFTASAAAFGAGAAIGLGGFPAIGQGLRKVVFLFDVSPYGKHSLFYPAIEKGYFKDAGLDVEIQNGKGSADVSVKVGTKNADFGFADCATMTLARGRGVPVKQFHMVHYKNMMNCSSLTSDPISSPKDLVGKTVGATSGDAARVALPGLAKINNFDHSKVEIITVDSPSKPALLMSGKVAGVLGLSAIFPVYSAAVQKAGKEATQFLYADYGLDTYNNGLITHDDTAKNDAGFVKAFGDAIAQSCVFAVENPDEAVEMFSVHNPAYNKETARKQLQVAIDHLMVPEVKEHGVGPMDPEKMAFTFKIVQDYFGLEGDVALEDLYSNDFVTKGQVPQT